MKWIIQMIKPTLEGQETLNLDIIGQMCLQYECGDADKGMLEDKSFQVHWTIGIKAGWYGRQSQIYKLRFTTWNVIENRGMKWEMNSGILVKAKPRKFLTL